MMSENNGSQKKNEPICGNICTGHCLTDRVACCNTSSFEFIYRRRRLFLKREGDCSSSFRVYIYIEVQMATVFQRAIQKFLFRFVDAYGLYVHQRMSDALLSFDLTVF